MNQKLLKNCIKLSCQIKIYVPSTINIKESFDSSEWVNKALEILSEEFGGATSTNALGAWINSQGELVKENVTMVFAYAKQDRLELSISKIYDFCLLMKKKLAQEAIALEINGEMYLV